jgi:hypothetical protein
MILEFELANPVIEILPKRKDFLTLKIEYSSDTTYTIINEITNKYGYSEIFQAFCVNELEEMKKELEQYIKDYDF